jgi:hypothetical protein
MTYRCVEEIPGEGKGSSAQPCVALVNKRFH